MMRTVTALTFLALVAFMLGAQLPVRAQFTDDATLTRLISKMHDPNPAIRRATAEKLTRDVMHPLVITAFIAATKDGDPTVRKIVAEALGVSGDPRAVAPLVALLNDTNVNIRRQAIEALGDLGQPAAVEPLLALYKKTSQGSERLTLSMALSLIGDPCTVPVFMNYAKSGDIAAILALGFLQNDDAFQAVYTFAQDAKYPRRDMAVEELGTFADPRASDLLLTLLAGNDERLRFQAASSLASICDPRAVTPLLAMLANPTTREMAASNIGYFRDGRAVEALCTLAKTPVKNSQVQVYAISVLGEIRDPRAVPTLMALVNSSAPSTNGPDIRDAALQAIAQIGGDTVVDGLLALLKKANAGQREKIIGILAGTADVRAREALAAALKNTNDGIDTEAIYGLAGMPDTSAVQLVVKTLTTRNVCLFGEHGVKAIVGRLVTNPKVGMNDFLFLMQHAMTLIQPELFTALTKANMKDPRLLQAALDSSQNSLISDPEFFQSFTAYGNMAYDSVTHAVTVSDSPSTMSIEILGELGDPRAIDILLPLTNSQQNNAAALRALAKLHAAKALPKFFAAAKSTNEEVRMAGLSGLGALKAPDAYALLVEATKTRKGEMAKEVVSTAILALGELGDPRAIDVLLPMLTDTIRSNDVPAATALAQLPPEPRTVAPLITVLNTLCNEDSRAAAAKALDRIQDPRVLPALLFAAHHSGVGGTFEGAQSTLATILGARKERQAFFVLVDILRHGHDGEPRRCAAIALGQLNDPRAIPQLMRAVKDPDARVRQAAGNALHTITGQNFGTNHAKWIDWYLAQHQGTTEKEG